MSPFRRDRVLALLLRVNVSMLSKTRAAEVPLEEFRLTRLSVLPNSFAKGKTGDPRERFLRISKRRSAANMPPIDHDCKLQLRDDGKWLLLIPCDRKYLRRSTTGDSEKRCGVSLDPGVRVFQTVYGPLE